MVVYLGDGAGGFTAKPAVSLSYSPSTMVIGDFNGDGKPDLALGTYSGRIIVMLGDGAGGFAAAPSSPIATSLTTSNLIVGDFDGDGIQDLLGYAAGTSGAISLFPGDGSGNFSSWTGNPVVLVSSAYAVVAADFNHDGKLDIAYTTSTGALVVLLSNATGSFGFTGAAGSPFTAPATFGVLGPLVITDLNGDGYFDLVGASNGSGPLVHWQNDGTGVFTGSGSVSNQAGANQLIVSDFNGDGVPDLAAIGLSSSSLYVVSVFLGSSRLTSTPVLSTTAAASISYGQPIPLTLSVTSNSLATLTGTATFLDEMVALGTSAQNSTPFAYTVTNAAPGSHTYTATYSGDANNLASTSNTVTILVTQATQTITFSPLPNLNFGFPTFSVYATASSGLPVTFTSSTTSVCTLSGVTVTLVAPGTCTIVVNQVGSINYAPATAVFQSFIVNPEPQAITFTAISNVALPAAAINLIATASSGLTVTFASNIPSVCAVQGATVQPLAAGVCAVIASQAGNATWAAAPSVSQSFTITAAPSGGGGGGGGGGAPPGGGSAVTASPTSVTLAAPVGGGTASQAVTISYQTYTQGAPTFNTNTTTNQGFGWLSVSPATGTMTLASYQGFLYTYTATVTITGNSTGFASGSSYTGTMNFSAGGGVAGVTVTMNVTAAPTVFTTAPLSLSFIYKQGDSVTPPAQSIGVFSAPAGASYSAAVGSGSSWLSITGQGGSGSTPGAVGVAVNVTAQLSGLQNGTIVITPANGKAITVPVSLNIIRANPQLSVSTATQSFVLVQGGSAANGQVTVANSGGGVLQFNASAKSDRGWLTLTGSNSGSATASAPAALGFAVNPSGLAPGVYGGSVTVDDANSEATATLTISLTVGTAAISLSQSGMEFNAAVGGAQPSAQTFTVTSTGPWEATAVSSGWLKVSTVGSVVTVAASTGGLTAGTDYGSVNVGTQTVSVVLNLAASAPITVSTGGLIFTSSGSQATTLFNPSASAVTYSASIFTTDGVGWLSLGNASGSLNGGANSFSISASFAKLGAGVQAGTINLSFSNGSSVLINVIAVVTSGTAGHVVLPRATASCAPYIGVVRQPVNGVALQVAAPQLVQVDVVDSCGNPLTAANGGAVQMTFSDGDAAVNLNDVGNGIWEATWTPQNTGTPVIATVAPSGASVTVSVVAAGANAPGLPTGIANAASAGQAVPGVVAPLSYVAIYGKNLAGAGSPSASSLPLPTILNGTQLLLGGTAMPLLYASSGQVNALVPEGLAANASYPLVVVRGGTQSVPVPVTIAGVQPGIYTIDTSGSGAGIVTNALTGQLITSSNPAHAGDYLVLYCTGLGAVKGPNGEQEPGDGAAAPTSPIFSTTGTVTATIGGVNVPAAFSGLTPTFAGLYQVNVQVPNGVAPGSAVPVVAQVVDPVSGVVGTSNVVSVAIQ